MRLRPEKENDGIYKQVKKWDVFEYVCHGSEDGNPFVDYWIKGHFVHAKEAVETDGFYDGNGTYRVRFMPSFKAYILSL